MSWITLSDSAGQEGDLSVLGIVLDAGGGTTGLRGVDSNSGPSFDGEVSGVLVKEPPLPGLPNLLVVANLLLLVDNDVGTDGWCAPELELALIFRLERASSMPRSSFWVPVERLKFSTVRNLCPGARWVSPSQEMMKTPDLTSSTGSTIYVQQAKLG